MESLAGFGMATGMDAAQDSWRLLEAAKAGDMAAFELLMRHYERPVLATALRLAGNLEDAKDAAQEAFFRLYRNLKKLDSGENVAGWLYRVTVNVCRDQRRAGRRYQPADELAHLPAGSPDPQQEATEAERRRVLAMSLRILSEKERAALVLRDLEGLSTGEVAQALGSTEATVRSQISKARMKVRDFVERYFRRRT